MPTSIPPMAVMQRRNEEALRVEIEELKAENARLQAALARAQVGPDRQALPRRVSLTEYSTASYMRPTLSSSRKSAAAGANLNQSLGHGEERDDHQSRYYQDGNLVCVGKDTVNEPR